MLITGATREIIYHDRKICFLNQRSAEWSHPYAYADGKSTMANAACGIFSIAHISQWMTGKAIDACALADYACACGGRGDDGTDRPILLKQLQASGKAAEMGFRYENTGHQNDAEKLFAHIAAGNAAICNLRIGHIVSIVESRVQEGEKQLLAIDAHSESADQRVRDSVREVVPGSEIYTGTYNRDGLLTGIQMTYAMFWVPATLPRDYNLLYRL